MKLLMRRTQRPQGKNFQVFPFKLSEYLTQWGTSLLPPLNGSGGIMEVTQESWEMAVHRWRRPGTALLLLPLAPRGAL